MERQEDRNYILSNLNVNLPLKIISCHIEDDFFWRNSYQHRWKTLYYQQYTYPTQPLHLKQPQPQHSSRICAEQSREAEQINAGKRKMKAKPWINIYMERHLQEFIENVTPTDYELERVQATLDICAAYINQLEINCLQPSMNGQNGKEINKVKTCFPFHTIPFPSVTMTMTPCFRSHSTWFHFAKSTGIAYITSDILYEDYWHAILFGL